MTDDSRPRTPWFFAVVLIVTGIAGWAAAFALTLDKIAVLENPGAALSCNFNVFFECGTNLSSWQGELLGFPNPLIGLGGFIAPIAVGVALLAGAGFARWFWIAFHVGVTGALGFCIWLISQSLFVIGRMCPWCMVVWAAVILMWLVLTGRMFADGRWGGGERLRSFGRGMVRFAIPTWIGLYLLMLVVAQTRMPLIQSIF